jgi:virginiamycin B lyase
LIADKDGNIWYTGNFKATVGKLNPKTGEVTEYLMPRFLGARSAYAIFDKNGTLWFTVQGGNMVGRLKTANRRNQARDRAYAKVAAPMGW